MEFSELFKKLITPGRDDYQTRLSYDQRAHNFNKYGIGTSGWVFYPLYALTRYLRLDIRGKDPTKHDFHSPDPYSHSSRLLEIKDISEPSKAIQYDPETDRIVVQYKVRAGWRVLACWDLKNKALYIPTGETLPLAPGTFESIVCDPLNKSHPLFKKINWLILDTHR